MPSTQTKPKPLATNESDAKSVPLHQPANGIELLLSIEARFREATSVRELEYAAVNEARKLTGARQVFLLRSSSVNKQFRVKSVSSLAVLDPNTPLIRWIEEIVSSLGKELSFDKTVEFILPAFAGDNSELTRSYPFPSFLWQPLKLPDGTVFAGLLQAREQPWTQSDTKIGTRITGTLSHAWCALTGKKRLRSPSIRPRLVWSAAVISCLLAGFIPVPMTTLAPMEIVAKNPFVIAAPIDGVLESIAKEPNVFVKKGEDLLRYDDTNLRNQYELAQREVSVAAAQYRKVRQGAFSDDEARFKLSIVKAEYELKKAERDYASDLLTKTRTQAPVSGLLIYSDKNELEGRPVSTGETIMTIADPARIEIEINLPVADSIVLQEGAEIRLFLNTNPLKALDARLVRGSYHAKPKPSGELSYKLTAEFTDENIATPRIGALGTAQVYGETVSLAFFLFRRPISFVRQSLGM